MKRALFVFLLLTLSVFLLTEITGVEFGRADYWDRHGILFLVGATLVPRLTLLFGTSAWGGVLGWLGWVFTPRLLIALLATVHYWYANPILVVIAWLLALGGESSEKVVVLRRVNSRSGRSHSGKGSKSNKGFESAKWV